MSEHLSDQQIKTLRSTLRGMKSRCTNPKEPGFKYYGGRGIKVFDKRVIVWFYST